MSKPISSHKALRRVQVRNFPPASAVNEKELLRQKIANDTEEFLKTKTITVIPTGMSGEIASRLTPKQKIRLGIRPDETIVEITPVEIPLEEVQADSVGTEPSNGIA